MPSLTNAWWPRSRGLASRLRRRQRNPIESSVRARRIVLFADPDTLREPGSHGWAATRSVVRALEDQGIAVVLWGNETRSEMELVQTDLHLEHPFISENGGGLFVRHGYFLDRSVIGRSIHSYEVVDFGKPYYEVADALHEVSRRNDIPVIGFSDMSIEEVAHECGLPLAQAHLAKLREYDEPFRIVDSDPATYSHVCRGLRRRGYRCFSHETLHHATGVADKTHSVRTLSSLYRHACDGRVLTIGLAQQPSETCLLHVVDIPVVVQSEGVDAARLGRKVPTARFIDARGPRGWCEVILKLVDGRTIA